MMCGADDRSSLPGRRRAKGLSDRFCFDSARESWIAEVRRWWPENF
jgi:hypothetical protein